MEFAVIVVAAHLPRQDPLPVGVLVVDKAADRLYFRFRSDLAGIHPLDLEVIQNLPEMIESMAAESGAAGLLRFLEDRGSNVIRLGARMTVHADNPTEALRREFAKHVAYPSCK